MDARVKAIVIGIVALVTLLNVILQAFGMNPFPLEEDLIFTAVSSIAAVIALAVAWWKNQNITQAAIEAQKQLDKAKGKE